MSNQELKEKIIDCMETADDSVLEAIYTLLNANMPSAYKLTDEQMKIVEEERIDYLAGKGETYDWEDVKARITQRK